MRRGGCSGRAEHVGDGLALELCFPIDVVEHGLGLGSQAAVGLLGLEVSDDTVADDLGGGDAFETGDGHELRVQLVIDLDGDGLHETITTFPVRDGLLG